MSYDRLGPKNSPAEPIQMQIRVLGCSGSIAAGFRTTSFLLDDDVLIDAGTGVGDLELAELSRVTDILLSHSHLDHILSVPLLADSVMRCRRSDVPIRIHALPATLDALHRHVLNGVIWPDFSVLPSPERPALRFVPFETGQVLDLPRRRKIEVLPALHTVPAVGFAVLAGSGAWVFTGDTGPNDALWKRLASLDVRSLVIETAFSNAEREIAGLSRHLCPDLLGEELRRSSGQSEIFITHIKPGETDAVMQEIANLGDRHRITALTAGQIFNLD